MPSSTQAINILKINALAELERIGWKFEPRGDNEVSLKCPVHKDNSPSVSLNVKKNVWTCHASQCTAKGDIVSLLAFMLESSRQTVLEDLHTRYELSKVRAIRLETVERHHSQIWGAGPLLTALRDRGVTDDMIRHARLGYHSGRIMIPVFDTSHRAINIRRYLPGAPGSEKMKNTAGYKTKALYQPGHTKFDSIWITGGEIKALVSGWMLKEVGIGAVAVTAGEGAWDSGFTKLFKDKKVYICMDIDAGGVAASKKIALHLAMVAEFVKIITIPLDVEKYPKGDVNDWIGQEHATIEDLLKAMQDAVDFVLPNVVSQDPDTDCEVHHIRLVEAINAEYMNKRIKCDTVVTAMDTTPYLIPSSVNVDCVVDGGKSDNCIYCPVRGVEENPDSGLRRVKISSTNPGILDMVNTPVSHQEEALKRSLGIPIGCKTVDVSASEFYTVLDVRLTPQLQISGDNRDHIVQSAFLVVDKDEIELNTPYCMSGRMFPHPKTQQAVLLMDKIEQGADNLASFKPDAEELKTLNCLRPDSWTVQSLIKKFKDRYEDISTNVTRIYKRETLHMVLRDRFLI